MMPFFEELPGMIYAILASTGEILLVCASGSLSVMPKP